jgi:hypothetical protein
LLICGPVAPNTLDSTIYSQYSLLATLRHEWGLNGLLNDLNANPFKLK